MENHKHKATILVVDDTPSNIHVLGEMLSDDYRIKIAIDGMEALRVFEAYHVDLVLLDVQMPGMDGYEVCRRMKAIEGKKDVPVIFCTTNNAVEDRAAGAQAGAVDYITKPVNFPMLRDRLKKHLGISN